jgi:hypothetical protein
MKQIERRIRKLEALDPPQERVRYVFSDCPEGDVECEKQQTRYVSNGGRAIFYISPPMSNEEWAEKFCTPD